MSEEVVLRRVIEPDLAEFFAHQLQSAAYPDDQAAFSARWQNILANPEVKVRAIVAGAEVIGYVFQFHRHGKPEVGYCLGTQHWGNGFAARALRQFLGEICIRPIYARVAKHNKRSVRVLEKCGFAVVGEDRFTDAGGGLVDEYVFAFGCAP